VSYLDDIARTLTSPRFETLEEARAVFPDLTLDEYTMARVINSEHGSGSAVELVAIGDADANKAAATGKSIFQHATNGAGYGAQGASRPVSSARAPGPRHVVAAVAVLRGPARGIARGARRYFDPREMNRGHLAYKSGTSDKVLSCSALGLLEAWTFARPQCGRNRCCANGLPVAGPNGSGQEEWVGPIPGIEPYELMLMRPATAQQSALYAEARRVIETRGGYHGAVAIPGENGRTPGENGADKGTLVLVGGLLALGAAGVYYLRATRIWT
jgi:hypothetical protein